MPLKERKIKQPLEHAPFVEKEMNETKIDLFLDKIHVQTLIGFMDQVARTTVHAHASFSEIFDDAVAIQQRITDVQTRIQEASITLAGLTPQNVANIRFSRTAATEAHSSTTNFLFSHNKIPEGVREFYDTAEDVPSFDKFDEIANIDKPSKLQYSNPLFFMERFVEAERKAQEEAAERRRKRKEERKARRRERKAKEKNQQKDGKKRVQVKAVQKKKYNVLGAEFADEDMPDMKQDVEQKEVLVLEYHDAPADFPPPPPESQGVPSPTGVSSPISGKAFPTASIESDAMGASMRLARVMSQEVAQGSPLSPPPPPLAAPPPPPPPPPAATAIASPPAFLSGIRQGVQLKQTETNAHRANPENDLLFQIRKGMALKKVEIDPNEKKPMEEDGLGGELMALLNRRKFIEEDSDESSDEEW